MKKTLIYTLLALWFVFTLVATSFENQIASAWTGREIACSKIVQGGSAEGNINFPDCFDVSHSNIKSFNDLAIDSYYPGVDRDKVPSDWVFDQKATTFESIPVVLLGLPIAFIGLLLIKWLFSSKGTKPPEVLYDIRRPGSSSLRGLGMAPEQSEPEKQPTDTSQPGAPTPM